MMAGGMFWLSRITEHRRYVGGLLGPMLITALGLGLLFVPMALVSLTKVRTQDTGVAFSRDENGHVVGVDLAGRLFNRSAVTPAHGPRPKRRARPKSPVDHRDAGPFRHSRPRLSPVHP